MFYHRPLPSLHPSAPSSSRCAAAVSPLLSASRRLFAHVEVGCAARVRVPPVGAGEAGDRRGRLCQSRGRPDAEGGSARRRSDLVLRRGSFRILLRFIVIHGCAQVGDVSMYTWLVQPSHVFACICSVSIDVKTTCSSAAGGHALPSILGSVFRDLVPHEG